MSEHAGVLALAAGLLVLIAWLALAYRRYARSPYPTDRRRRFARVAGWIGLLATLLAYGWLGVSTVASVPSVAGLDPLTVCVAGALLATGPLLIAAVLALPANTWT